MLGLRARAAATTAGLLLALVIPRIVQAQDSQSLPSPDQARQLLRDNPQLQEQLRQRIEQSGMTQEQIRERLRAMGYPENELDDYLSGTPGSGAANGRELDAARALGLVSTTEADTMQTTPAPVSQFQFPEYDPYVKDSLRADSLGLPWTRPLELFGLKARGRVLAPQSREDGVLRGNVRRRDEIPGPLGAHRE